MGEFWTEENITDILLANEQLAGDVRELTYKVTDLTETVEILTRIIAAEQLIFCLTNLLGYAIMKTMKRDFWSGIRPLGLTTLLALSEGV